MVFGVLLVKDASFGLSGLQDRESILRTYKLYTNLFLSGFLALLAEVFVSTCEITQRERDAKEREYFSHSY